jgi:hypothetical protein
MATSKKTPVARETYSEAVTVQHGEAIPSPETALRIFVPPLDAPVVPSGGSVAVWMPPALAPGVRAFGDYRPGSVYHVAPAEALRLVTVKGFRFASMADHEAVSNHVDGMSDAAPNPTPQE